ncbi:hypothetical protein ACQY0O_007602 [Thecaphora frezii]
MKFTFTAATLGLATASAASPILRRQDATVPRPTNDTVPSAPAVLNDTQILQYALTLEHLEAAFYNQSLSKLFESDFTSAGYNATVRNQLYSIGRDEAAHVDFLTAALGNASVAPCDYNFTGVIDVPSFLAMAQVLEGVGVSAYLGAARNITDKQYLADAASVLTVESRHASYIHSQLDREGNAIPAPFDTPLDFNQIYSLAAPFLGKCPDNQTLPLRPFPAATLTPVGDNPNATATNASSGSGTLTPGAQVRVRYDNNTVTAPSTGSNQTYLAILQGAGAPTFLPLSQDGSATLPANLTGGQAYAIVTSSDSSITDDTTIAGPAVAFIDVPLPTAPDANASASSSSAVPSPTDPAAGGAGGTTGSESQPAPPGPTNTADAPAPSSSGSNSSIDAGPTP